MRHIAWKCPNCGAALIPQLHEKPHVLRCENRHSFDVAKQGYVNLLLPQKRGAALPGDNAEMVRARTAFLDGGYYRAFSDGVNRLAADALAGVSSDMPVLADAGCGEGYYTARLHEMLAANGITAACVGFDLSRDAAAHAAKRARANGTSEFLSYAVASLFEMPLANASVDGILNLFAPVAEAEFARILRPGGFLLMAVPAEDHLWGMKQVLYETPYKNEVRRDFLPGFSLTEVRRVTDRITVTDPDHIRALFAMTPYYWKTSPADRDRLYAQPQLETEIAFDLLLYHKDDAV